MVAAFAEPAVPRFHRNLADRVATKQGGKDSSGKENKTVDNNGHGREKQVAAGDGWVRVGLSAAKREAMVGGGQK